jgi:ABC-2 type transport system permease protein
MREVLLIARREYQERVRSRAFLLMTILFPVMIGLLTGGSFFGAKLNSKSKNIAIASNNSVLAQQVGAELQMNSEYGSVPEVVVPASDAQRAELNQRVNSKALDGYLWLQTAPGSAVPSATFISRSAGDVFSQRGLQSAVNYALERVQLMQHGVTATELAAMKHDVKIETMQIQNGRLAPSNSLKSFAGAYVMMFLIYFSVVFYGMNVARSVVEEKTSRIFEVLLSTVQPQSLMAGKLLGVGAAGLTQLAIWCVLVMVLLGASTAGGAPGSGGLAAFGVHPAQIFFLILYFLFGFFFYSAIAAAIGASVSSEQEIQQFSMVIVAPLLVGIILMRYIIGNPTATPVVLLSLFPPCAPVVMFLRMSSQMPPAWQIALSMVLMLLFIWGAIWVASRVYRVGILMYGKRATLPEILRWMRYS